MKKATKQSAIISAILVIAMCISLMVGGTYAYFTDTATTNVNKIQAGTLNVALEMKDNDGNWVDAEGKTLQFLVNGAIPADNTEILWEPGCTYSLPELRVINKGNLALKYKVIINGINGSAKLNEVIEWTVGDAILGDDIMLKAGEANNFTIKGHMKEEAGNEYQGLSLEGISITVYATQVSYESDSTDNTYDKNATYDLKINSAVKADLAVEKAEGAEKATVKAEKTISDGAVAVTYPVGVVLKDTTAVSGETDKTASVEQKLEYVGDTVTTSSLTIGEEEAVASYELTLPVAEDNTVLIPVEIAYEKNMSNLRVFHNGVELTTEISTTKEYFVYDKTSGKLTLYLLHASPIEIVYHATSTKTVKTQEELASAFNDENIKLIKLANSFELNNMLYVSHSVTVDFCGNTITCSGEQIEEEQCVLEIVNTATSSNKLIFKDSVGGGEFNSTYGAICLLSSRAQFELNDVTISCEKGTAIEVYGLNFVLNDNSVSEGEFSGLAEKTSIVVNSGKIVVGSEGNGAISSGSITNAGAKHTITINGGEIVVDDTYSGIYLSENCSLTINNCTFTKKGSRPIFVGNGEESSSVTINNITFVGTGEVKIGKGDVTINDIIVLGSDVTASVIINDGTFTVNDTEISYKN